MNDKRPIEAKLVHKDDVPFQERRMVIVCLMVFAALFLGFPFLWRSRQFSVAEKLFWTIAVSIETVLIFWGFWVVMKWSIERIQDSLAAFS